MGIKLLRLKIARRNMFLKIGYGKCGKHSVIFKPLMIENKKSIFLGDFVTIFEGARIEVIKKWNEQSFKGRLEIGDNTYFENNCHIIAAYDVIIGKNNLFAARNTILSVHHNYSEISVPILNQKIYGNKIIIGNNCFFGMDVKIFPGVTIGDNVIVGANSIVINDLPSYCVAVGVPAKIIKKYNFKTKSWEKV